MNFSLNPSSLSVRGDDSPNEGRVIEYDAFPKALGASNSGQSGSKPSRDANGLTSRSRGNSRRGLRPIQEWCFREAVQHNELSANPRREPCLARNGQSSHPRPNDLQIRHGGARASFAEECLRLTLRAVVPGSIAANAVRRILNSARLVHQLCRERKRRTQLHLPESALCAV
jgi:hypothetical protein